MLNKFTVIGGDLRSAKLAQLLADDGNIVTACGLERAAEITTSKNIIIENDLDNALEESDIIIAPIPFSKNGEDVMTVFSDRRIKIDDLLKNYEDKILVAGNISQDIFDKLSNYYKIVYDLMSSEQLTILNTIATAEGAIDNIIQNTDTIIHGSNILILGFGRVAKTLAYKLKALDAMVTCAARKEADLAWIKTYGYDSLNINFIKDKLEKFDVIINTVPHLIIGEEELRCVRNDVLLVDLSSKPGGIDFKEADRLNIKYVWALALPGKVAPLSSAVFIKDAIYEVVNTGKKWYNKCIM